MPTIHDIARQSGVSIATVSLALNNRPGVAPETRARVLEAASQVGYPLKAVNEGERLRALGMLVKTISGQPPQANPFYSQVMIGIEQACRRQGIDLLFATLPVDAGNHPTETPAMLSNEKLDGLLLVGAFMDKTLAALDGRRRLPLILVDAYSQEERYDAVLSDNFGAAYQAVAYLLELGHRHIGLLGGAEDAYPSLRQRRNGYLRALKDHEIGALYTADFNINETSGGQAARQLLENHPQVSALFCVNDEVALAALRTAQEMGRRVPDDLAVIGYDDTYLAVNATPSLTTLHVDTIAMGQAAVHLLALRLDKPDAARMTLTIHPTLVERNSTARWIKKQEIEHGFTG